MTTIPDNWRALSDAETIALAKTIVGAENVRDGDVAGAHRIIQAYVSSTADPDPLPRGNGVAEELGGPEPDWLPSKHLKEV